MELFELMQSKNVDLLVESMEAQGLEDQSYQTFKKLVKHQILGLTKVINNKNKKIKSLEATNEHLLKQLTLREV